MQRMNELNIPEMSEDSRDGDIGVWVGDSDVKVAVP